MRIYEARRIWERQMDDTDIDSQLPFHIWLKDFERTSHVDPPAHLFSPDGHLRETANPLIESFARHACSN
jgi:hypothetical protein